MASGLTVWLYEQPVARIERVRRRLRLAYTETALETYGIGVPLLSIALPITHLAYPNATVRTFLQGLLPEGDALREIAESLNLRSTDTYELIGALGRDCAGALVIQPEGEPALRSPSVLTAEPLNEAPLAGLIDNLRTAPLGIDRRVRISLGGAQEKLLLTRMPDGGWGRPVDGTPSTHILKPQIRGYPHTVENEAFCMRVAAYTGHTVADVETADIAGRPLLVIRRYDREVRDDGGVERIHQEDFCQALGLSPSHKYEEHSGPTLRRIASVLQAVAREDDLDDLLRAVVLNVAIGNGDAHGKNFSLLHERSGRLRLAPLYDLLCTLVYGENRLAMYIDSIQRIERVTAERIENEAASWGMSRRRVHDIVCDYIERLPAAIDCALDETAGVPQVLIDCVRDQFERLRSPR